MSGRLTIRVTATDTSGATATQDFQVTVINTNDGPVASAVIADQSTNEDAGFSFTVPPASFSDVDVGDSLTLSATLADGSPLARLAQLRSGNPDFLRHAPERRCRRARHPRHRNRYRRRHRLPGLPALPSTIPMMAPSLRQSLPTSPPMKMQASASPFRPPASAMSMWATASPCRQRLPTAARLPAWLSFDAATQTFSGTPLNDDVGALTIRVTATDTAGATATQDFRSPSTIPMMAPSLPSALPTSPPMKTRASASPCRPPASAMSMSATASPSRQRLPTAARLPAWLSFDAATQTFSGTPLNDDVGALDHPRHRNRYRRRHRLPGLQVTVNNTNDGPVASVIIADQSTNEDAGFSFTVPPASFSDVDVGDSLTLSATLADGSPLPAWLSFDAATQTFSGTPLNDDVGPLDHPRHRNRYRRRHRLPGLHRHRHQYQ